MASTVDKVYEGVTAATWPKADFIVGNPPFGGDKRMRIVLGVGYTEALRAAYADIPESCDFVMYWWHKAAGLTRASKTSRFGFITTNSITQIFNRRVVSLHLEDQEPLYLAWAVPDHPWVDASDGAAVRIAMTVGEKGTGEGVLASIVEDHETGGRERAVSMAEKFGIIHADLRQGVDITQTLPLKSNESLSSNGVSLHSRGFVVSVNDAKAIGLGRIPDIHQHIRPLCNGRDIAEKPRNVMVIDLFGLSAEQVRDKYPEVYQWVYNHVKPERDQNNRATYRERWWIFGEPRRDFRPALAGLSRFIVTVYVAKHRYFVFLPAEVLPDDLLIAIASDDAYWLGVLSSHVHVCWALASGSILGPTPRYNKSLCFATFPFPNATPEQQTRIRDLGEKLDAHRKDRQALHPDLTMTSMYNVLEALRQGRELTTKEKIIHEQGLVTVLRELHDNLDAAVAKAYGWPADLPDEEILSRLVALNAERVEEEKGGLIRWLRPEYQTKSKAERKVIQASLDIALPAEPAVKGKKSKATKSKGEAKQPWPSDLLEQTQAVRGAVDAMRESDIAITADSVAERFARASRARVQEILRVLSTLGLI